MDSNAVGLVVILVLALSGWALGSWLAKRNRDTDEEFYGGEVAEHIDPHAEYEAQQRALSREEARQADLARLARLRAESQQAAGVEPGTSPAPLPVDNTGQPNPYLAELQAGQHETPTYEHPAYEAPIDVPGYDGAPGAKPATAADLSQLAPPVVPEEVSPVSITEWLGDPEPVAVGQNASWDWLEAAPEFPAEPHAEDVFEVREAERRAQDATGSKPGLLSRFRNRGGDAEPKPVKEPKAKKVKEPKAATRRRGKGKTDDVLADDVNLDDVDIMASIEAASRPSATDGTLTGADLAEAAVAGIGAVAADRAAAEQAAADAREAERLEFLRTVEDAKKRSRRIGRRSAPVAEETATGWSDDNGYVAAGIDHTLFDLPEAIPARSGR